MLHDAVLLEHGFRKKSWCHAEREVSCGRQVIWVRSRDIEGTGEEYEFRVMGGMVHTVLDQFRKFPLTGMRAARIPSRFDVELGLGQSAAREWQPLLPVVREDWQLANIIEDIIGEVHSTLLDPLAQASSPQGFVALIQDHPCGTSRAEQYEAITVIQEFGRMQPDGLYAVDVGEPARADGVSPRLVASTQDRTRRFIEWVQQGNSVDDGAILITERGLL